MLSKRVSFISTPFIAVDLFFFKRLFHRYFLRYHSMFLLLSIYIEYNRNIYYDKEKIGNIYKGDYLEFSKFADSRPLFRPALMRLNTHNSRELCRHL